MLPIREKGGAASICLTWILPSYLSRASLQIVYTASQTLNRSGLTLVGQMSKSSRDN